jgi:hypothetical protein
MIFGLWGLKLIFLIVTRGVSVLRTARADHWSRSRPPDARVRLPKRQVRAFCAGTGSAA